MRPLIQEIQTASTPESLVERLAGESGIALLRSNAFDSPAARYSFVTANPFLTFRSFGSRCKIEKSEIGNRKSEIHFGNPWHVLDALMARYELLDEIDSPFPLGGVFGYWGYDLKNFTEPKLPRRAVNDLELPDCHVGFYDSLVVFDHQLGQVSIVSTGLNVDGSCTEQKAGERLEFWRAVLTQRRRDAEAENFSLRLGASAVKSNLSRDEFISKVKSVQKHIRSGDIYQVNLSQRLTTPCELSGWELFKKLNAVSPAPFSAFLDCGDFQLASSSPEQFLRLSGSHIVTRPIKGTRPRSNDATQDAQLAYELQTSAKELAELVMITDLLRNDLGKVCEYGSVQVLELAKLEKFAQVQHLVSTVEGRLRNDVTHFAAFASCFPGGSITGAPKFRAMEIIDELEPISRGPYCGAIGYLGFNRESQMSIAIRTAVCRDGLAHFNVGAGIVADSNAEAEYEETLAKARGFFAALNWPDFEAPSVIALPRIPRLGKINFLCQIVLILVAIGVFSLKADSPPAAEAGPCRKVVQEYALVSANDFPQRDPCDWRLLASNDDGRTWITLDTRKGEFFSERHQRRIFKITNQSAFNIYRLEIDRVRDPAVARAVQVAEIEPLGEGEQGADVMPIFADAITAQGANPPVESALQAFDGRVETKWLDQTIQFSETRGSWIQWQYLDHSTLVITNLEQLRLLRAAASENFPVHVAGVLIGPGRAPGEFCVLDDTGDIQVSDVKNSAPLFPGQRVLLEGKSRWMGGRVEIGQAVLTARTQSLARAEPKKIVLGQRMSPDEDFQDVEVEGQIRFLTLSEGRMDFELFENEHSLLVHVLCPDPAISPPPVGTRVRVRGICKGVFNGSERVAGILWASGAEAVTVTVVGQSEALAGFRVNSGSPAADDTNAVLTSIRQIELLSPAELLRQPKVKVRGVLTEPFSTYMQAGTEGIELINPVGMPLQFQNFGSYVEVEGNATWGTARGPAIVAEKIRALGEGKLPEPERPSWTQLAGGQMNAKWIEVDAVVRATDGSHLSLDYEGRQMMATIRSAPAAKVRNLIDASIVLRGVCVNATDDRGVVQGIQIIVPSLDYVMVKTPSPDPWSIPFRPLGSLYRIGSQTASGHRVRIEGTLTFQEGRKYFLQQSTNGSLMVVARADVMLNDLAPGSRWVFWQSAEEDDSKPVEQLHPGDKVEVVGFPETHGYAPMLTEALVRKVGESKLTPPVKTTANELAKGRFDSTVVSLEGLVLGRETLGKHCVLQIQSGQHVFHATLRVNLAEAPQIASGSLVRLTGVCQMELAPYSELGKSQAAFSLLLRLPSDIAILQAPPWWTVKRALTAVGTLLLVLLAAVIWIRMLHRKVEEKTRQLRQEITDHEKTEGRLAEETKLLQVEVEQHKRTESRLAEKTGSLEKEIEERKRIQAEVERIHKQLLSASRLAGMADVATNVLHNVGNVLNSVNVLAASIAAHVQKSKVPGVARVAALLASHQPDLGRFMTEDENGRHVPSHLERLGAHLLDEQTRLQEKTKSLTESIQHIKEIVAMQQNYAKVAGVCETLPMAEMVEDALRMCRGAMSRHKIEVVRDYEDLPPVTLDRHKVLQIIFNLLENAKHACELRHDAEGKVIVRIRRHGRGRVRLQVIDNGIGIPRENLARIFTQGFSTKKSGHGFGLHGSILAAQEMNGSLTVESGGAGQGATFTLEFSGTPEAASEKSQNDSKTISAS